MADIRNYIRFSNTISADEKGTIIRHLENGENPKEELASILTALSYAFSTNTVAYGNAVSFYQICRMGANCLYLAPPSGREKMFYSFLAEEIRKYGRPVCVILDSVSIYSTRFVRALIEKTPNICFGVFNAGLTSIFPENKEFLQDILRVSDAIIMFSQAVSDEAKQLAEESGHFQEVVDSQQFRPSFLMVGRRDAGMVESKQDSVKVTEKDLMNLGSGCYIFKRCNGHLEISRINSVV